MSYVQTPQPTQTLPQAGNSYLGDVFLAIMKGGAAMAVGAGVATLAPVAIGAAAVLGTAGYATYTVGNAVRRPSAPQSATDKAESGKVPLVDGRRTGARDGEDRPGQQATDEQRTEGADKSVGTERLAPENEAEAKRPTAEQAEAERVAAVKAAEVEAERVAAAETAEAEKAAAMKREQDQAERLAAESEAEAKRLAAEQEATKREAEAKQLAAEQAEAERVLAVKAAEESEQVRLRKVAEGLLLQINGKNKATGATASKEESDALELERQALRIILQAVPLTVDAIKKVGRGIEDLVRSLESVKAQIAKRAKDQREADQKKRAEDAAAGERERQQKADEAAAIVKEAWCAVSEQAKIVLASVESALAGMKDVQEAANKGTQSMVERDKGALVIKLEAGAKATPNEKDRDSVEQLAQKLKGWEASVTGVYDAIMNKNLADALGSSKKKDFAQERDRLLTALMTTTSTASDISDAYAKMTGKEGPWTPENERTPAKTAKKQPQTVKIEPIGMGNLMSMLPNCLAPTETTWKSEGNGTKRNSFYQYSNGMEIHVHRDELGEATKAHAKLSKHNLTMGTARDNDIPTENLPAYGIQVTEVPVLGTKVT